MRKTYRNFWMVGITITSRWEWDRATQEWNLYYRNNTENCSNVANYDRQHQQQQHEQQWRWRWNTSALIWMAYGMKRKIISHLNAMHTEENQITEKDLKNTWANGLKGDHTNWIAYKNGLCGISTTWRTRRLYTSWTPRLLCNNGWNTTHHCRDKLCGHSRIHAAQCVRKSFEMCSGEYGKWEIQIHLVLNDSVSHYANELFYSGNALYSATSNQHIESLAITQTEYGKCVTKTIEQ